MHDYDVHDILYLNYDFHGPKVSMFYEDPKSKVRVPVIAKTYRKP